MKNIYVCLFLWLFYCCSSDTYDVCIYGGTSAGVSAAYTAASYGKKVILIEPSSHLGGLSSGGLGATDVGNQFVVTGVSREFYRQAGAHYGNLENWTFEPHIAEKIFDEWSGHPNIRVVRQKYLHETIKKGTEIKRIKIGDIDGNDLMDISAKMFIDCTYEGDLLSQAQVSFIVGREDNNIYRETLNGFQMFPDLFWGEKEMGRNYHQFPDGIDPYVEPGNPDSGLLYGIGNGIIKKTGEGDTLLQAYNYRLCLTNIPENRVGFKKPDGYNPDNYELLRRVFALKQKRGIKMSEHDCLLIIDMPNGKTDVNNRGPMSTDHIGMNYNYPKASYYNRKKIALEHRRYTEGLLYFLTTDAGVPCYLRKQFAKWGWAKDEFTDNDNFPYQLYVREARRMVSDYVMTEHHCRSKIKVNDAICLAAFKMDSHHTQRMVVEGMVKNEGDVQVYAGPPYPVSYRALIPKRSECTNLLVPVCLSASHIAYGSIRMEPIFMVLGQSAALGAIIAIDSNTTVQDVDVTIIQKELMENPYANGRVADIFVDDTDAQSIIYSGDWNSENQGYKFGYRVSASDEATVTINLDVKVKGSYSIYLYKHHQSQEILRGKVCLGSESADFIVNATTVDDGWLKVGQFMLDPSRKNSIEIYSGEGQCTYFDGLIAIHN